MIAHLAGDFLRRMRDTYLWWGIVAALIWAVVVMAPRIGPPALIAVSLAAAFMTGPFMSIGGFETRALSVLPVSRRELWLAQWVAAVVVGPVWNLAGKLAGMSIAWLASRPVGFTLETLTLSVACDAAYCGAILGMAPFGATRTGRALVRPLARLPASVLGLVVLAAGASASFFVLDYLPGGWADLIGWRGLVIAAALALAYAGHQYEPRIAARDATKPLQSTVRADRQTAGTSHDSGPTGITLLFAREWLLTFAVIAAGLGLFLLLEWRDGRLAGAVQRIEAELGRNELPFRYTPVFGGYLAWVGGAWFPLLVLAGRNALVPMMRHLRALPLSSWRVNAYIIALAFTTWAGVFLVCSSLSLAATGRLPSIAIGPLIAFAGMTAVAHSVALTSRPHHLFQPAFLIGVVPIAAAAAKALAALPSPGDLLATPIGLGAAGFAIAACRNHYLLGRSSTVYRRAEGDARSTA